MKTEVPLTERLKYRLKQEVKREAREHHDFIALLGDPSASRGKRLAAIRNWDVFPRMVLAMYETELRIAQRVKTESIPLKLDGERYGGEEPSDTAYNAVSEVISVDPGHVKRMCREERRNRSNNGYRDKLPWLSAAEFGTVLDRGLTWLPHNDLDQILGDFQTLFADIRQL